MWFSVSNLHQWLEVMVLIFLGIYIVFLLNQLKEYQSDIDFWKTCNRNKEVSLSQLNHNLRTANSHILENKNLTSQLMSEKNLVSQLNSQITTLTERNKALTKTLQKYHETQKKAKSTNSNEDTVHNQSNNQGSVNECVICLESQPMTCFIPCGHISTCVSCAKCMVPPSCPICRSKNGQFYNIFNSTTNSPVITEELKPKEIIKRKNLIQRFLDKF